VSASSKAAAAAEATHNKSEAAVAGKRKVPESDGSGDEGKGSAEEARHVKAKVDDLPAKRTLKKHSAKISETKESIPVANVRTNRLKDGMSLTDVALGTGKFAKTGTFKVWKDSRLFLKCIFQTNVCMHGFAAVVIDVRAVKEF
jgi:hypothetical protein